MKVITLYKAPFAKNMLYCTEKHFLLKSVQKNLPAVLYYRIQNYHENKQKLGCLFLCVEAFSKNCTLLSGIWFTLLFSPFCKFLISLYLDLEDWCDSKGVCHVCTWKLSSLPVSIVECRLPREVVDVSCNLERVLVHSTGIGTGWSLKAPSYGFMVLSNYGFMLTHHTA